MENSLLEVKSQSDKIVELENTIKNMNSIINGLQNKLEKIESKLKIKFDSDEYYFLEYDSSLSKYCKPECTKGCDIPKKIDCLIFANKTQPSIYGNYEIGFFAAQILYHYESSLKKYTHYFINDIEKAKIWCNHMVNFNIKNISIQFGGLYYLKEYHSWSKSCEYSIIFLDTYLGNKKNFIIDEISIDDEKLVSTIIKYTNYKKLIVYKSILKFNYDDIEAHCISNNIEFYCK
jgi:hypothetical protein